MDAKQAVLSTTQIEMKTKDWIRFNNKLSGMLSNSEISPVETIMTTANWSNRCIYGQKNDKVTLNIHHQSSEDEPTLVSVLISLNERLELHVLMQRGLSHGMLDSDHSYRDNHPLIVHFFRVFQQVPEMWLISRTTL